MKTLLITLLLIFGMKIYGQILNDGHKIPYTISDPIKFSTSRWDDGNISAFFRSGSDTLEILRPDKIHFIKIGDRVYKIESPTLTEVKEAPSFGIWRGSFTPVQLTTDTIRIKGNFYNNGGYTDTSNIIYHFNNSELKGIKTKQP